MTPEIFGLLCGFIFFVVGIWLVAEPFLRPNPPAMRAANNSSTSAAETSEATQNDELELDYRTGKMSEADYLSLKEQTLG